MTTAQIEQAILSQYDNGRYSPLGADGGALKYIMADVYGTKYRASITLDHDIAQIRRIWELSEVTAGNVRINDIYNFTKQYYEMRI